MSLLQGFIVLLPPGGLQPCYSSKHKMASITSSSSIHFVPSHSNRTKMKREETVAVWSHSCCPFAQHMRGSSC